MKPFMLLIRLYLLFLLLLIFLPSLGSVSIEDDLSLIQNRGELDRYGNLMLVGAAASGRFEVVQALLSQKHGLTQIDRKNKHGDSPLTAAIWGGHLVVAELLIESGANINIGNRQNTTPMMLACNLGAIPLAKGLVEKGADLSVIDRMGYTALMYASAAPASSDSSVDLVKTILEKGTKQDIGVNAKSKQDGHTALLLAASSNNWDICKALIVHGVTLDNHIMNENELAVIHLAAASGQVDVTQLLIEHGAEVNTYSKVGNKSPLYMAAKSGSVATATALLKAGADPNHRATDRDNFTPLMVATVARDKRMVRALLEGRADPTVKCHQCSSSVAISSPSSSSCVERTARELARTRGVEREWADMASLLNLAETEWRLSHKENERGEREK